MKKLILVLMSLVFVIALGACNVCKPGTMRCHDNKAELCDKKGQWKLVMKCNKIKSQKGLEWCCKCTPDKKKCYCSTKCYCEKK